MKKIRFGKLPEALKNRVALGKRLSVMIRDSQLAIDHVKPLQSFRRPVLISFPAQVFQRVNYSQQSAKKPLEFNTLQGMLPGKEQHSETDTLEEHNACFMGRDEKGAVWPESYSKDCPKRFQCDESIGGVAEDAAIVKAGVLLHPQGEMAFGMCTIEQNLGTETTSEIIKKMASREWPKEVLEEVKTMNMHISAEEKRVDLTHLDFLTIDSKKTKRFDDAVYGHSKEGGGWKVWVAIADVAHYVLPNGLTDLEAQRRRMCVYLPKLVLPMLPERLSNDLCSLKPHELRRALVCALDFDAEGNLQESNFLEGIIKSRARLTYEDVESAFQEEQDGKESSLLKQHAMLRCLCQLYKILVVNGQKRCALHCNRKGLFSQTSLKRPKRGVSNGLIQELMIQANVAAAQWMLHKKVAGIYRTHDRPHGLNVDLLKPTFQPMSLAAKLTRDINSNNFDSVSQIFKGGLLWPSMQMFSLRSLKSASYEARCREHFGLKLHAYTHFTSPIRRYPDVVVHRILKYLIKKERGNDSEEPHQQSELERIALLCTMYERRKNGKGTRKSERLKEQEKGKERKIERRARKSERLKEEQKRAKERKKNKKERKRERVKEQQERAKERKKNNNERKIERRTTKSERGVRTKSECCSSLQSHSRLAKILIKFNILSLFPRKS